GAAGDHGNLVANLTATGNSGGVALTSLSVAGNLGVAQSSALPTLLFSDGNVGTIAVKGLIAEGTIRAVPTAAGGAITSITAGQWEDNQLTARTIATLKVTGRPAATAATQAFNGDMLSSTVVAFVTGGATPGIGTFSVAGSLSSSTTDYVLGNNGITSFTVG